MLFVNVTQRLFTPTEFTLALKFEPMKLNNTYGYLWDKWSSPWAFTTCIVSLACISAFSPGNINKAQNNNSSCEKNHNCDCSYSSVSPKSILACRRWGTLRRLSRRWGYPPRRRWLSWWRWKLKKWRWRSSNWWRRMRR